MCKVRQNVLSIEQEGEAARLNAFSSKEQEVGDPLCQGLILGALKECGFGEAVSRVGV
jgi:hypothetical protein